MSSSGLHFAEIMMISRSATSNRPILCYLQGDGRLSTATNINKHNIIVYILYFYNIGHNKNHLSWILKHKWIIHLSKPHKEIQITEYMYLYKIKGLNRL